MIVNRKFTRHYKQHGFTLLEIMLVFLLMAMVSVGVMMTLPNMASTKQGAQWQAERFSTLVKFAEDEALISGLQLGIVLKEGSYQFAFYDYQSKSWSPLKTKQLANKIELPDSLTLTYSLSGVAWDELDNEEQDAFISDDDLVQIDGQEEVEELNPLVYLMSSGEVTPFEVTFSALQSSTKNPSISITVSSTGNVTLSEVSDD